MIEIFDKETHAPVGEITQRQLEFLKAQLEEESVADHDYYINQDTLELFERNGADAGLLEVLRRGLGDRTEMEIEWEE